MTTAEGDRRPHPDTPNGRENTAAARKLAKLITSYQLNGNVRQWGGAYGIPLSDEEQRVFDLQQSDYSKTIPAGRREGQSLRFKVLEDRTVVASPADESDYYREKAGRGFFWNELWISPQGSVLLVLRQFRMDEFDGEDNITTPVAKFAQSESLVKIKALQGVIARGAQMLKKSGPGKLYSEKDYKILLGHHQPQTTRK